MHYTVRHLTTYRYARTVRYARCSLRLWPREGGGQRVTEASVTASPPPSHRLQRRDFFGLDTITLLIDQPHREFSVEACSRIIVERPPLPDPNSVPPWEVLRAAALGVPTLSPDSPAHCLFPSSRVPLDEAVTDYARVSFPEGRSALEGALELMKRIRVDFRFDSKAATASTPLAEAFAIKAGVCQDFAHVMIAGLRGLGLPAAYVSGYLRTLPPPGRPRLRGADASHAWVALWLGPAVTGGDGWLGLDPTNGVAVCDDHIELARGRDYGDVAPIDGIVSSSGAQRLKVEVDVIPADEQAA